MKIFQSPKAILINLILFALFLHVKEVKAQPGTSCNTPTILTYGVTAANMNTCNIPNNFNQTHTCGNSWMNSSEQFYKKVSHHF